MQAENHMPDKDAGDAQTKEKVERLLSGLDPAQQESLNTILRDEEKLRQILDSPAAKRIMEQLKGRL